MSDYISKSALIEEIERQKSLLDKSYDWSYYATLEIANIFCKIINNQPTLSETEIISKAFERVVERLDCAEGTVCGHKDIENNCGGCAGCSECKMEDAYREAIGIVKEEGGIE